MLYDLLVLARLHRMLDLLGGTRTWPRRRVRYAALDAAMVALNLERLLDDLTLLSGLVVAGSLWARHRDVAGDRVAATVVTALAHLLVLLDLIADMSRRLLRTHREIGRYLVLLLPQQVLRRVVVQCKGLFLLLTQRITLLTHVRRASLRYLYELRTGPLWLARRAIAGIGRLDDHGEVGTRPLRRLLRLLGRADGRGLLVLLDLLLVAMIHVHIEVLVASGHSLFDPINRHLTVPADAVDVSLTLQGKVTLLAHVCVHILIIVFSLNVLVLLINQRHLLAASADTDASLAVHHGGSGLLCLIFTLLNNVHLRRLLE